MAQPNTRRRILVACDLDDVLASTNEAACHWHNKEYGTSLSLSQSYYYHYWKNPGWGTPRETLNKVQAFYASDAFRELRPIPGAKEHLQALKANGHHIVIVTARGHSQQSMTEEWLRRWYPGVIDSVYYTGEFVKMQENSSQQSAQVTKYSICQSISAAVLIDDNLNHVLTCATSTPQLPCVLFGDYEWNKRVSGSTDALDVLSYDERARAEAGVGWWERDTIQELPQSITRCNDWEETVRIVNEIIAQSK